MNHFGIEFWVGGGEGVRGAVDDWTKRFYVDFYHYSFTVQFYVY